MRIVGILLIAALMVLPVIAANRVAWSLRSTFVLSMAFGLGSVISGLSSRTTPTLPPGGTIVLVAAGAFALCAAGSAVARRRLNVGDGMIGGMSPVVLTGSDLTLDDVLAVARGGAQVEIDAGRARARWHAARAVVDRSIADGTPAYGVTTGVGSRKVVRRRRRRPRPAARPPAPDLAGRARSPTRSCGPTALRLANALARATTVARPELAVASRRGAERRPAAGDPHARLDRPERSRPDGRSRRRRPRRLRARAGRGDRAAQPERVRDGLRRARVRRRARAARRRSTTQARSTSRRSAPTGTRVHPAIGEARPVPRAAVDARPPRRAARGQRGRGARPAGPAHVPDDRPAERRRPRRASRSSAPSSRSSSTRPSRIRSSSSTRTG